MMRTTEPQAGEGGERIAPKLKGKVSKGKVDQAQGELLSAERASRLPVFQSNADSDQRIELVFIAVAVVT